MSLIFDNVTQRELSLIKMFYQNRNEDLSITSIKNKVNLNCSEKTIIGTLKSLMNPAHTMNSESTFTIIKDKGIYRGEFTKKFSIEKLYYLAMLNSVNFKILDVIFKDEFQSVKNFSKENFSSYSAMYNRVKKMNSQLGGIVDFQKKLPALIIKEELTIRFFYTKLYFGLFGLLEENFQDEFMKAKAYLASIQFNGSQIISQLSLSQTHEFTYYIVVSLVRMKQRKLFRQVPKLINREQEALLGYVEDDFELLGLEDKNQPIQYERKIILLILLLNIEFTNHVENEKVLSVLYKTCPLLVSTAKKLIAYSEQKFDYPLEKKEHEILLLNLIFKLMNKEVTQTGLTLKADFHFDTEECPLQRRYNHLVQQMTEDKAHLQQMSILTIEEIAGFLIQYSLLGNRKKKVYLGTVNGRSWDQKLSDRIFTIDLATQIELCEFHEAAIDLFISDVELPHVEEAKFKLIPSTPDSKEIMDIRTDLYQLLLD